MTKQTEAPALARRIFFTGALQAVDRQLQHLNTERERIEGELARALAEIKEQAGQTKECDA
ncbi:hypothetical protein [Geoalkalibacter sp.]|uniref:hypothetical protein n=1 Tax=Geoalkalibacter sp. TaxID=3041440 RepID=UPI00272E74AB|nr:hypothetical protein [Geoalkalibacter sp.]